MMPSMVREVSAMLVATTTCKSGTENRSEIHKHVNPPRYIVAYSDT